MNILQPYIGGLTVSAIHTLLEDTILGAEQQLQLLYQSVPELYGEEVCTACTHALVHSQCVRVCNWRPLWVGL